MSNTEHAQRLRELADTLDFDILYVVDGYEITLTRDGCPIEGGQFRGATLADAIDTAMMARSSYNGQWKASGLALAWG